MPRFMAIYTGSPEAKSGGAGRQTPKTEAAGMAAWGKWMSDGRGRCLIAPAGTHYAAAIVDEGAPLGVTKLINNDRIADTHKRIAAYVIVEAPSHEKAATIFINHPHFAIFPGDVVEVMECLPMPRS